MLLEAYKGESEVNRMQSQIERLAGDSVGMRCRLCLQNKELCESHLIPEFFYKPLYDFKHRFEVVKLLDGPQKQYLQKGTREKLLCSKCETKLSRLEDYARRLFYGGEEFLLSEEESKLVVRGIDYVRFKLFQLSVLWRAAVSNHNFFQGVKLAPGHEERLRKMLHTETPGEFYEYGCVLLGLRARNGTAMDQLMERPFSFRSDGHRCYRFLFGGHYWVFVVSKHTSAFLHKDFFLSEDGTLIVHLIPPEATGTVRKFARILKELSDSDSMD